MNTTTEQAMSLEEFETGRHAGKAPGKGPVQNWIRELPPLTPMEYPLGSRTAQVAQGVLGTSWRGGPHSTVAMQDEKGGDLRTSVVDGKLWVVWYPNQTDVEPAP